MLVAVAALSLGTQQIQGASKVNNFNYVYVSHTLSGQELEASILFIANEPMHIQAVQGAVSVPAAGTIGLYVVKGGAPCRDPATNAPNGLSIFDVTTSPPTTFNLAGQPGPVTTIPLSKVPGALALAPGSMICAMDVAHADQLARVNLTISLGP
jgi:hypothetical protein